MTDAEKQEEKILCDYFKVKDTQYVSKSQLGKTLAYYLTEYDKAIVDLFCSDPYHKFFEKTPENLLAPLRIERIKRLDAAGKKI
jgi:hypothetical protein